MASTAGVWMNLPEGARVVVDTAPIVYLLEDHPQLARRFLGLFEAEAAGLLQLAVSTITVAEVMAGPLARGKDALAQRYLKALEAYDIVAVDTQIAASAARLRARYRLKLPDALQLATALETGAQALVTHDRDFRHVEDLDILYGG